MTTTHLYWKSRLTDAEYRELQLLVADKAGICLGAAVREHITDRVLHQMTLLGTTVFAKYLQHIENDQHEGIVQDLCKDLVFHGPTHSGVSNQAAFINEWAYLAV
ncbi:MAG TPA: hypothetical protein PKM88_04555 [bacterium]|nr:hypothetical protein [bacterium]